MEGTRSKRNLKESCAEGSTNSNRAVYSVACHAQSNDGQTYFGVGKLNGRPVKVLQDKGCTGMIVDDCDGDNRQSRLAADGGPYFNRCAVSKRLLGFTVLQRTLQGDVFVSSPVYPVIIGDVRGARWMLPDSDWKAEDQPGVRAMTSGGNKDKDNDDDQGGDIPAWMFKKKSSQEKTEKSARKKRDYKKKPAQHKENDDCARRNMKVKEGVTEAECELLDQL